MPIRKFHQERKSSTQDELTIVLDLDCHGDLETNYTEFVATAGTQCSKLFEYYGSTLTDTERQRITNGIQTIFDPLRN